MTFENDIPKNTAHAAFSMSSFDPEKRGDATIRDYADTLKSDYEMLSKYADTEEKKATLENEFIRYRQGYRTKTIEHLNAQSRCMSSMITGPSNFPVARNQKCLNAEHNRLTELIEYRERALNAIKKTLCPELRPIMAGDADATERIESKLGKLLKLQAEMKAVNAAHKAFLKKPESLDACTLPENWKALIRNYKPEYSWIPHPIAPYQFTNLSAQIRTLKARGESIEKAQSETERVENREHARLEDSPKDNRIRLFFEGKPEEAIRNTLKSNGFRWTPSLGCWQAYRNYKSIKTAEGIAGMEVEAAK